MPRRSSNCPAPSLSLVRRGCFPAPRASFQPPTPCSLSLSLSLASLSLSLSLSVFLSASVSLSLSGSLFGYDNWLPGARSLESSIHAIETCIVVNIRTPKFQRVPLPREESGHDSSYGDYVYIYIYIYIGGVVVWGQKP